MRVALSFFSTRPVMRALVWLARFVVFVLLLAFLSKNSGAVKLQFFLDTAWNVPLSLLMLGFFVAGVLLGLSAPVLTVLRQRREIGRLRRDAAEPPLVESVSQ